MMYRSEAKKDLPVAETPADRESAVPVKLVPTRPGGWDPFEVWRERIQRPRELSGKTAATQLDRARQKS